jgi:glycerol-3-phosphate dehydrogenase
MRQITTDVLVIGGGATGVGVLRDLAMRGIRAVLVEKGDLTHGTSGRYHGLLHSGGRYVVKDKASASECAIENEILRRIMPHCLEDTGGFFVVTPADDESYVEPFLQGCKETGVPVTEISVREALQREPLLNPRINRVFAVRDAAADSFLAARSNAEDARQRGAQVLTYHYVKSLEGQQRITGAVCEDLRTGEDVHIHADYIVNAAGAWAGKIAALAGVKVTVVPGKGTMVAMNHRVLNTVVNRCKMPADGDIIVPIRTVAVIGTTDVSVPDPDVYGITPEEVAMLLEEGEQLVPGISRGRVLRAWAGVRPLYKDQDATSDRDISRTYKLLDHEARDGVTGLISIVGGKWTTYRLMAQEATDAVAARLGVTAQCRTHSEPLPALRMKNEELRNPTTEQFSILHSSFFILGQPLARVEAEDSYGELICECELVTRDRVIKAITEGGAANVDDIRRETRLGMGPCQGGFCTYRAVALWDEVAPQATNGSPAGEGTTDRIALASSGALLRHFLQERWKGLTAITWGDQLRQMRLDEIIFLDTLGIDLLPQPAGQPPADTLVTEHPSIATEYHVVE